MSDEQMNNAQADILIVDDKPASVRLLIEILGRRGYTVRSASDGPQALLAARKQAPDLILLDVMLPGMSGYEVCQKLKADEATRDIPVIFISALAQEFDKVKGFSVGGVDYIPKPFHMQEVLARVRSHVALYKLQEELEGRNADLQREIAVRRQAEAALCISQERYQMATQVAGVGVWDWNLQTGDFYLDSNLKAFLGYTDEEIPNDPAIWMGYVHPDDRQPALETLQAYLDGQTPAYTFEYRMLHKDGSVRWFLTRGTAIRDEHGQTIRLVGTDMDITERMQAKQALERQLTLETIIATHASRLINLGVDKLDDEIRELLSALGMPSSVDGIFVLVFDSQGQKVEKHYEWLSGGQRLETELMQNVSLASVPWALERLSRFEPIICEDVRDLPPQADREREILQAFSIQAFLVIPLIVQNELVGCYGYHSAQPGTGWTVEDVSLLRLLGHILSNVIDRRRTEARLHKLSQAIEQSPSPVVITDMKGNIEYVNHAFTQVTGYTAVEVLGRNPRLLKSGVHSAEFYADLWNTIASGRDWRSELVNRRKNGELYWEMASISPLRNAAGEITHFIKVAEDITRRKEAEDSLRELQLHYQALFERAPLGIALTTPEGRILATNESLLEITGYTQAELLSINVRQVYQNLEDRARFLERLHTEGFVPHYGVQMKRKDGTPYYANLHGSLIKRDDEDVVLTVVEDVTERVHFEAALERHNRALQALHQVSLNIGSELKMPALLRNIMERAVALLDADRGGGIYMYDPDENVLRLVEGTGINADRVGFVLQANEGMAGQVFQRGNPLVVNDYTHWKGRATVLVSSPPSAVMGVPLLLDGQVIGVLGLIANSHRRTFAAEDVQLAELFAAQVGVTIKNARLYEQAQHEIAERRQAEAALRNEIAQRVQAEGQIKAALAEKETLLKELHHRVKNNLQVISTLLDLQAGATHDDQVRVAFEESQQRIQAMAGIHEQLYRSQDLARVDMAAYVDKLVAELHRSYATPAVDFELKVLDVALDVDQAIPCGLIINELVSNTLKHAFPAREIRDGKISVTLRPSSPGHGKMELIVSDNGVGLPADFDLETLDTLGLTMVCLLAGQLEGNLEFDTQARGGTTFKVIFGIR
jgi:PAS domain S-box-containing protein